MKTTILLLLLAAPALAAEPPDWYSHIPAEQRAALLAARHAAVNPALIDGAGVQRYRRHAISLYAAPVSAPKLDLTKIVYPVTTPTRSRRRQVSSHLSADSAPRESRIAHACRLRS